MSQSKSSTKLKILVLGPKNVGKSCMTNFLSSLHDIVGKQYIPTKALRVCEFERKVNFRNKIAENVSVELWDVSGDQNYSSCWPAIVEDVDGILFMYNPTEHTGSDLQFWHQTFAQPLELKESSCLLFAHYKSTVDWRNGNNEPLTGVLSRIATEVTCLDTPQEKYRHAFDSLLANILATRQEKEEQALLNRAR